MKIKLSIMLTLFWITAISQPQNPGTIKELKVGDTFPINMELGKLINASKSTMKLSDSKADLIILDFWATYCGACRGFFKTTERLEKEFNGKVQFIPVTDEKEETAYKLLKDRERVEKTLPISIVEDEALGQFFPHYVIPHEVWIDRKGVIKAITGYEDVNSGNITKLLQSNQNISLAVKRDIRKLYGDLQKPLFMQSAMDSTNYKNTSFYSFMNKYDEELPGMTIYQESFINLMNCHPLLFFQFAFGENHYPFLVGNRCVLELKDPLKVNCRDMKRWKEWKHDHLFSYELYTRDSILQKNRFDIMRGDINNFFRAKLGIEGRLEKRKVPCWVLERTSKVDKLKTKGLYTPVEESQYGLSMKNHLLMDLMNRLQGYYQQDSPLPLLDNTGYTGKVDLELNCDLQGDISGINAELKKYDLAFVKKEMLIDMIVISDVKKGK